MFLKLLKRSSALLCCCSSVFYNAHRQNFKIEMLSVRNVNLCAVEALIKKEFLTSHLTYANKVVLNIYLSFDLRDMIIIMCCVREYRR